MTAQGTTPPHGQACQRCGREHPRCAAHNRQGGPCGLWPLAGQRVCGLHGGRTPNALRRASERLVEQQARRTLASLAVEPEPIQDAVAALEKLAGEVVALVGVLRGFVSELEEIRYRGGIGAGFEQARAELSFYLTALQRAESVLAAIVKLNLDERRVRIGEAEATLVVAAVTSVLRALGLDAEQQQRARTMLARELGSVSNPLAPATDTDADKAVLPARLIDTQATDLVVAGRGVADSPIRPLADDARCREPQVDSAPLFAPPEAHR